jgi:magnesium-transporting ATPase (P-type)
MCAGQEIEVPVEQVVVGDKLTTRPGEKIPTDCKVLSGTSAVDESLPTGASVPGEKQPGATFFQVVCLKSLAPARWLFPGSLLQPDFHLRQLHGLRDLLAFSFALGYLAWRV